MAERKLSPRHLVSFREYLIREEKSTATIEKYLRDTNGFLEYAADREITKELAVAYKAELQKRTMQYALSIPCWHPSTVYWIF